MKKTGFIERADGRLQTTVTDPKTGKRIYFYGNTARELKEKILNYHQKKEKGKLFTEISADWWEEAEPNLAHQSKNGYLAAKRKADVEFADISIKDITAKDVTAYLRKLSMRYSSQKSLEKFRLILNLIFKYAVESGEIEHNPCPDAKMPKNLQKSKRKAASKSDEDIIKKKTDGWLLPYFAIYTGMRKGEILALQWKDIDLENEIITVSKSVYHDGDRPYIKEPKTEAGKRKIPLLKPLKERLLSIPERKKDNFIFSDNGAKPLTERRYSTLFKKYKEETGITCTSHQLRHSFATIAFENGISPKDVQELLGHKQLSTTMDIYTEFREEHLKELTQKLNEKIR